MALHVYGFIMLVGLLIQSMPFRCFKSVFSNVRYELTSATVFLTFVFLTSFNVTMVFFFKLTLYMLVVATFYFIFCVRVSRNCTCPFDLPEAESESVAGIMLSMRL
jgi:NADH:ubiquinone oxidoreductase subunit H